jgi:hypothetical protein
MSSLTSESAHGENSDGIPSGLQDFCSPEQDQGDGNDVTDLEQYHASAENSVQCDSRAESCTCQREPRRSDLQISPNTTIQTATKTRLQTGTYGISARHVVLTASLGCTRARCGDTGPYRPSRAVLITIRLATVIRPCVAKAMASRRSASRPC